MTMFFVFFSIVFACTNVGSSVECSNNGICVLDQRTNSTRCVCDAGFFGSACADLCTMTGFATECSQNGICAFDKRVNGTRCVCDMGFYGRYCNTNTTTAPTPLPSPPPLTTTTTVPLPPVTTTTAPPPPLVTTTIVTITPPPLTTVTLPPPITTANGFPVTFPTAQQQSTFSNCVNYKNYLEGEKSICSGHGKCVLYPPGFPNAGYYCDCEGRYYGTYCEKEYKSKLTAFLLEFFIGWTGAESFYIGDIVAGIFKLLLGLVGCCCGIVAAVGFFKSEGERGGAAACCMVFVCLCFCTISIWVTVNWIMILANAVKDGQGNPLYQEFK